MDPDRIPTSAAVLVLGRDAVVGKALELLLRSADYNVKFLTEPSLDEPGLLDGVQLLLLAPGLSAKRREALLTLVSSMPVAVRIPVLELASNIKRAQVGTGHLVPWPCRAEDLERRIKAALLAGSETSQDGRDAQTRPEGRRMVGDQSFG